MENPRGSSIRMLALMTVLICIALMFIFNHRDEHSGPIVEAVSVVSEEVKDLVDTHPAPANRF